MLTNFSPLTGIPRMNEPGKSDPGCYFKSSSFLQVLSDLLVSNEWHLPILKINFIEKLKNYKKICLYIKCLLLDKSDQLGTFRNIVSSLLGIKISN